VLTDVALKRTLELSLALAVSAAGPSFRTAAYYSVLRIWMKQ
jgi:uncharacterized membrane protein